MSLTGVNINNVSMDYFLRGVDAAKPQGVQPSQVPQDGANAQVDKNQEAVGKMVSQLDVLLMKAAMASTKGLDGKQIKGSLKTLVDQGLLDKGSFKLLAQTADTAAKTLRRSTSSRAENLPPRSAQTTNTTSRRRRARPSRRLSRRSRTFPRFSDRSARS